MEEHRVPSRAAPQGNRILRSPAAICLALAVLILLAYCRVPWNDFVNYDDSDYVTANTEVQGGMSWQGIRWAFTAGHASNWHPLAWISHMLDWQLFGNWAGGHHLTSLVLHIANTLLLFFFLRCATGSLKRSALVAGLFALHPLHVESVAWVSERKDVLSGFFFMLTLLAYTKHANQETSARARRMGAAYGTSLLAYTWGLMSKPMLVTMPCLLLLLDYWPLRRFRGDENGSKRAGWLVLEKLPFLALAVASSVVTYLVQREGGAVSVALNLKQRLANAVVAYATYIRKTVWPSDLAVLYPHPGDWPSWRVALSACLLVGITGAVLWIFLRKQGGERARIAYLPVGWFWFLGMLVPVIGIVQVGIQSMADRYTYLPLIGLFLVVSWGVADLVTGTGTPLKNGKSAPPAAVVPDNMPALVFAWVAVLGTCALLTFRQAGIWQNSETLFSRTVKVTTGNYLAYNNLGYYFSGKGKVEKSIEFYEQALRIKPDYEDALNNMGYALAKLGRHAEAVPFYERALRASPKHVEVHNNLGNALSELGRLDEAIAHYEFVLKEKPTHADAHNNLAIALAMKGKIEEAIGHFERALDLNPKTPGAHSNLGNAYALRKQFDKAEEHYNQALKMNPKDAQAHNNLGNVLFEQNRTAEAIEQYQTALRLNPNNPEGHYNLGMALLRTSTPTAAIDHFRRALEIKPDYQQAKTRLQELQRPASRGHDNP